jgi:hypothetical protein
MAYHFQSPMADEKRFAVAQLSKLIWPDALPFSDKRFRLFVAADTATADNQTISEFALAALSRGMVYFCVWGPDCERFHDIVDQIISKDDVTDRRFAGPNDSDVVMTTWHDKESLPEALDYFATCAVPTDGFMGDSGYRFVICVGDQSWAAIARECLESARFFI